MNYIYIYPTVSFFQDLSMRGHHLHISAFCHGESWHFRLFWRRGWGFQPCENAGENPPMKGTCWKIVFYVVFTHIFREVASLTSPRNSMDWRAALDILREMQVEEVAPDLPLCQPWNGQCFGPQLIAPFLPYWNKSWKRIAFGVPIFGTHENYIFFCSTLTFAGCTPIWVYQQKG